MSQTTKRDYARLLDERARRKAKKNLLAFTRYTFDGEYRVNWHHRVIARKLEAFARGELKRLILCLPPRHGKSELASRRMPAWILGRNPSAKVIATSYGQDLANDNSRDVKAILGSDAYRRVFPDVTLPSDPEVDRHERRSYTDAVDQWQTVGDRGQYLARGVGGGTTGKGGQFLIVDDPIKDDEEAQSASRREKIWKWYTKVLKTRRAKDAGILIIMTRWHLDDLVGRLKKRAAADPAADQWEVVELPALAVEGKQDPNDPREPGEALWPEFKPKEEWEQDKSEDPEGFAALGQQNPTPEGGRIIKTTWTENRWDALPAGPGTWVWSCDPKAGSKDPKSSRAVLQLWFQPRKWPGRVYLVDQVKGLWDAPETLAKFRHLARVAPWKQATAKLVEDKADGRAVVDLLKSEIPGLIAMAPRGDKAARCRAVSPFWQAGNIWLPQDEYAPWVSEFVHELTTFPGAEHDDQVDAMSIALAYLLINEDEDPVDRLKRTLGRK